MPMKSINPATGTEIESFETITDTELEAHIQQAHAAAATYRRIPLKQRAEWLSAAAEILENDKTRIGRLMTQEMGKPLKAAVAEAEKCAWVCRYYAENGENFLRDEEFQTDAADSRVVYQPLGVILAVMPWNFPFWQLFRFAAPALMAGNVALLKHASNVPRCALEIEDVFTRTGFPAGVFQTLLIESGRVEQVIADDRVKAATLTGSTAAGRAVATVAGHYIKKTVLELGGSDPYIVMPSADLEQAVQTAVKARTINNGQSCIAAKRFILHQDIAEEFSRRFVALMHDLTVGDPMSPDTDIGPLATEAIRSELIGQVESTTRAGATLLTGGKPINGPGWFFQPTVLSDIPEGTPAYSDELFGPVASLFTAPNAEEAIRLANATPYGLGAAVWTRDRDEAEFFSNRIESGAVFVNRMVASDPRLPFGGVKQSGYGRELGPHGIKEFVNAKTVVMDM